MSDLSFILQCIENEKVEALKCDMKAPPKISKTTRITKVANPRPAAKEDLHCSPNSHVQSTPSSMLGTRHNGNAFDLWKLKYTEIQIFSA